MDTPYSRLMLDEDEEENLDRRQSFTRTLIDKVLLKGAKNNVYDAGLDKYLPPLEMDPVYQNEKIAPENTVGFFVDYINFPSEIEKKQVRCKGQENQQRLDSVDSKIKLALLFEQTVHFNDIFKIELKVRRAHRSPNHVNYFDGCASLSNEKTKFYQPDSVTNEIVVISDLDSVYKVNGEKVYELSKANPKLNEFEVVIFVYFHGGGQSKFATKPFLVKGTQKHKLEDNDLELCSPRYNKYLKTSNGSENFAKVQRMVTDVIEAKQGSFNELFAKVIKSGNGDIAYHFVLKDQFCKELLSPGEIVGFTSDKNEKVVIEKLTLLNSKEIFLKGVVTDSQYLECNINETEEKTATICMLGLVPVNVIGSVYYGEALYASPEKPGVSISEHYVNKVLNKKDYRPALVGHAFQKSIIEDNSVHQVQALVSLINSAEYDLISKELIDIETRLKIDITEAAKSTKRRNRKYFFGCFLLALMFSILVTVLIYQLHTPGSAYKYWQCRRVSNGQRANYWYWLKGKAMHGIEMDSCDAAWDKAFEQKRFHRLPKNHHIVNDRACLDEAKHNTTFHYYINLDSCAEVINENSRFLFATDAECSTIYHLNEKTGHWVRDKRICSEPKCNIWCSFTDQSEIYECDIDNPCPDEIENYFNGDDDA